MPLRVLLRFPDSEGGSVLSGWVSLQVLLGRWTLGDLGWQSWS